MENIMGHSQESGIEVLVRYISEAILVVGAMVLLGSWF